MYSTFLVYSSVYGELVNKKVRQHFWSSRDRPTYYPISIQIYVVDQLANISSVLVEYNKNATILPYVDGVDASCGMMVAIDANNTLDVGVLRGK